MVAFAAFVRSASADEPLALRVGSSTYSVATRNALSLAHTLLKAKKYDLAAWICEAALRYNAEPFQAAILLACCKAGLREYSACNHILQSTFAGNADCLADHLQDALVCQSLGMTPDAVSELVAVADGAPHLPIIWLLLGDGYAALGDPGEAMRCWQAAIDRDARGGAVATAARRQLNRLQGKSPA